MLGAKRGERPRLRAGAVVDRRIENDVAAWRNLDQTRPAECLDVVAGRHAVSGADSTERHEGIASLGETAGAALEAGENPVRPAVSETPDLTHGASLFIDLEFHHAA